MAPKKLSEADKQDILSRYRQTEDTTATLASRYGVSTSTVSRILKQSLPEEEYEALIHRKRSGAFKEQVDQDYLPGIAPELPVELPVVESPAIASPGPAPAEPRVIAPPQRRQRRSPAPDLVEPLGVDPQSAQLELAPAADPVYGVPPNGLETRDRKGLMGTEEFDELDDELEDDLEDEDLEDHLDEDELDDEDGAEFSDDLDEDYAPVQIQVGGRLQVLPLSDAQIPRTCYVVVDRSSELITRPLKDFADLGQIPAEETQEKTLPIFDNHRVAKRFLRRMQRIVKVPDGRIFQKVKPYLQAKGITRLLIDGQVYSL